MKKLLIPLISLLLWGCAPRPQASDFPLKTGVKWEYQAEFSAGIGDNQAVFPRVSYTAEVKDSGELEVKQNGENFEQIFLAKAPSGDLLFQNQQTFLPAVLKKGEKWPADFRGETFQFTIKGKEQKQVPAGEFDCWAIKFHSPEEEGQLWLAPGMGIVELEYQSAGLEAKNTGTWKLTQVSGL